VSARRFPWRGAARLAAAVLAMYASAMLVSGWVFPFAGGAFHAMFAYSDGHLPAAYLYFRVHVGTVCAVAALLVAGGWRLPWGVLALAATVTAASGWWSVYTWPNGQSQVFHRTAGLLLVLIPLIAFAACGAAHALRRRMLARIVTRPRIAAEPGA
jgi:hypothetical protein